MRYITCPPPLPLVLQPLSHVQSAMSRTLSLPMLYLVPLAIPPTKLSYMLSVITGSTYLALLAQSFPAIPLYLLPLPRATSISFAKAFALPNQHLPPSLLLPSLVLSSAPSPPLLPSPPIRQSPRRSPGRTGQPRIYQVVFLSGQGMGWSIYWLRCIRVIRTYMARRIERKRHVSHPFESS